MKAIRYFNYGSPDVLELRDVPRPVPGKNEILIRVYAAAVNPYDWHFMRGSPYLMRAMSGLFRPKVPSLGIDLAGEVAEVGEGVNQFGEGDRVFGVVSSGAFAEYALVPVDRCVTAIPDALGYKEAAAFPVAAITALQGLRAAGGSLSGQQVLINGASGGVGTFAVQLAKHLGAIVTSVCSTRNLELVRELGAATTIDYTREDFCAQEQRFDLIFDLVGNRSVRDSRQALAHDGRCVICGFSSLPMLMQHMALGPLTSIASSRKVRLMPTARPNTEDLAFLASLAAGGSLKPVIDRTYPLAQVADAIRYLEKGHARGKIVIIINR